MLPEGDESPERIRYQAASPDEAALVTAAKNFGFFFYRYVIFVVLFTYLRTYLEMGLVSCLQTYTHNDLCPGITC